MLERLAGDSRFNFTPFQKAAADRLNQLDETFRHLNEAIDRGMGAVVFFASIGVWDDRMRADPRFDALLERIGHPTMAKV